MQDRHIINLDFKGFKPRTSKTEAIDLWDSVFDLD